MSERNSRVELLRIIATFMILISHFSYHGFYIENLGYTYINNPINQVILPSLNLGSLGVDIFVLITGFYGFRHTQLSLRKNIMSVVPLITEVWFYSVLILLVYCISFGSDNIQMTSIIRCIFPTSYHQYWFFTAYIMLRIISPYLNLCIEKIEEKQHFNLIILMIIAWCICPVFFRAMWNYNDFTLFIMLYVIGAFFGKYHEVIKNIGKKCNMVTFVLFVLWIAIAILMNSMTGKLEFLAAHSNYFYQCNSILTIMIASAMLLSSARVNQEIQWINKIAKNVFAVYLITDHPLIRDLIWKTFFAVEKFGESNYLLLYALLCCLLLFAVGVIVEFTRKQIAKIISEKIDVFILNGKQNH